MVKGRGGLKTSLYSVRLCVCVENIGEHGAINEIVGRNGGEINNTGDEAENV